MYKVRKIRKTSIKVNASYEGESIEDKIKRITNNKEPIKDGAPRIYTERKDGVLPGYDIRTDRFEVAVDAMDKVTKSHQAKREARAAKVIEMKKEAEQKNNGGTESTEGK